MKISFLPKQIYFEWFTGGHLFNFKVERQNYLILSLKFIRVSFSPHRLIKLNHAETFHSKLFPSVSRWPENLKVLLFLNVSLFLRVRGIGVRRLEITVISRFAIICLLSNGRDSTPVSPSPPSSKCFNPSIPSWNHPPCSFSSHVARTAEKIVYFCLSQIWYLWPCLQQPSLWHNSRGESSCD